VPDHVIPTFDGVAGHNTDVGPHREAEGELHHTDLVVGEVLPLHGDRGGQTGAVGGDDRGADAEEAGTMRKVRQDGSEGGGEGCGGSGMERGRHSVAPDLRAPSPARLRHTCRGAKQTRGRLQEDSR